MWAPRSRPRPLQAALKVDLDGDGRAARKFFNLSERYDRYREYRSARWAAACTGCTSQRER
jgi:hypothetical protein